MEGKLLPGIAMEPAEQIIEKELEKIKSQQVEEHELNKVKNRIESQMTFSEAEILNKAMNLAFAELLGDASLINREITKYLAVTADEVKEQAIRILKPTNCSTLYYLASH